MVKEINWPKRYRSEEVACTLCKAPTREQKAICRQCLEVYEFGKSIKKYQQSSEKFWYYFYAHERLDCGNSVSLSRLLETLTGEYTEVGFGSSGVEEAYDAGRYLTDELFRYPAGHMNWGFQPGPYKRILLTEAQGQLVKEFWALLKLALAKQKQEGQRDGSHFLKRLAEGDLTFDQINAWHNKTKEE